MKTYATFNTSRAYIYEGHSMWGTFIPGDIIIVSPVSIESIKPGDIIAFHHPVREDVRIMIIHRVKTIKHGGITTKGDVCPTVDLNIVTNRQLAGKVNLFYRKGKAYKVWGGLIGHIWGDCAYSYSLVISFLRKVCKLLRFGNIFRFFLSPHVELIEVKTNHGIQVKYTLRGRSIASWWPEQKRFQCTIPYFTILAPPEQ